MDKPYDYEALMALITDEIKQETGIECYEPTQWVHSSHIRFYV